MLFYRTCILLLFLPCICFGQNDTSYFDEGWLKVSTKDSAVYFRPPIKKLDNGKYELRDYYLSTGNLQAVSTFLDEELKVEDGYAIYYHKNGKISSEGMMQQNIRTGVWKFYDENSPDITSTTNYSSSCDFEVRNFYSNENVERIEKYINGKMTSGNCFNKEGLDTTFYLDYRVPYFKGSREEYVHFFRKAIRWDFHKRPYNVQGEIEIEMFFDEQGKIYKAIYRKKAHPYLDKMLMNVVHKMPLWQPAKNRNGLSVKSTATVNVTVAKHQYHFNTPNVTVKD